MLDLTLLNKRYFEVKIGTTVYELEPPKVKMLRDVIALSKSLKVEDGEIGEDAMEELAATVAKILSKNRKKKTVDAEFVYENLELEAMILLLDKYFEWVGETQADPN